ncbi:rhodanese-like domain-containing protein [Aurantibacter sp.]|uniref:rhodanese-like domain-containing protein n=1 Tax=Aurantibacter sp. TaxID=2807103 RepID=UPI003267F085
MSLLGTLFGIKKENSDNIEVLNREAFADAIMVKDVQLVDVRTASEYGGGHIKNANNIDFFNPSNFESSFNKFDKQKPIYLYCRSGARSRKAAKKLINLGFSKVYDLKGGYMQWG